MPAYNFKQRFAEAVEAGTKRQTIRRPRKRPTRQGDRLRLYTGMRTKGCRLLREVTCTRVVPVRVGKDCVRLDGRALDFVEASLLAIADGFINLVLFYEFFERLYGLPVELELIEWEVD